MLYYEEAKRLYKGKRKPDPHVGRRLRRRTYINYCPEQHCYSLSELWSKVVSETNPDTGKVVARETPDKSKWSMRPWAYIHEDRVEIVDDRYRSQLYHHFAIDWRKPRSIMRSGKEYWVRGQSGTWVQGELPLVLWPDGNITLQPSKVRTFDQDKRREMNALIAKIRKDLTLRAKLGTFDKLSPIELNERMKERFTKWEVLDSPQKFTEIMRAVDPSDISSYHTLLWLANRRWYYHDRSNSYAGVDWVERFNKLVDSMRERMRKGMGVVSYVDAETLPQEE